MFVVSVFECVILIAVARAGLKHVAPNRPFVAHTVFGIMLVEIGLALGHTLLRH